MRNDIVNITNRGGVTPVTAGDTINVSHCYSTTQSSNLAGSYAGTGINGQGGIWSVISGPNVPTINNVNQNNTGISNLIEGTYVFVWNVTGECASGSDTVAVIVPAATSRVTIAAISGGGAQYFCDGRTSTVLTANTPEFINESVQWTYNGVDPDVVIESPNSPVTTVSGLTPSGSYSFTYIITNDTTNCSSSAGVTISFAEPATMNITPSQVFLDCNDSEASIPYTADGGNGGTQFRILSGPLTVVDSDTLVFPNTWADIGVSPAIITGLTGLGTYTVQFRRNAPEGFGCSSALDQVYVITSFENEESNAGTDQVLDCGVDTTRIAGNSPKSGQGTWSQVSGPAPAISTGNIHDPNLFIEQLVPGYILLGG